MENIFDFACRSINIFSPLTAFGLSCIISVKISTSLILPSRNTLVVWQAALTTLAADTPQKVLEGASNAIFNFFSW